MENKITLAVLARMLSDRTGRSRKDCEDLLRSFFQNISASLASGEGVKVRGFGTFKISQVDARMSVDVSSGQDYEIPAHNRIVFLPAKEIASVVNAPFEMFETIEIADSLTDEDLQGAADVNAACVQPESEDRSEEVEHEPARETVAAEPEEIPAEPDPEEMPAEPGEIVMAGHPAEDSRRMKRRFRHGFMWGAAAAVCVISIGLAGGYFFDKDFHSRVDALFARRPVADNVDTPVISVSEKAEETEENSMVSAVQEAEAVAAGNSSTADAQPNDAVPTKPSDQPVYDTVTPTAGLGAMARKHYGNYHFWPYIYKENEKILGHPDRIKAGTRVVVPPLSKYGVDRNSLADLEKAKNMGAAIYSRYKKNGK